MRKYSDQELITLLDSLESDRVERKESFKGDVPKKARQAVCAFANDLPNQQPTGCAVYWRQRQRRTLWTGDNRSIAACLGGYENRWQYSASAGSVS